MAELGEKSHQAGHVPEVSLDRVTEWLQLLSAVRLLCESLEGVVAPFGLMLRDYELLRVRSGRVLSQSELVRQLDTSKVSESRGVRRLSAESWVSVTVSTSDKRANSVVLTDAGIERFAEVEAQVNGFLEPLAPALNADERPVLAQINDALQRLRRGQGMDGAAAPGG